MDDQNKNLILATALSFLVILVWFVLFPPEEPVSDPNAPSVTAQNDTQVAPAPPADNSATGTAAQPATETTEAAARIAIKSDRLTGSISLLGGRIDDLSLNGYRETLKDGSDTVTLLRPVEEAEAYYALFGWAPGGALGYDAVPGANTLWTLDGASELTPDQPINLVWDNGAGLTFRRTISVDQDYLFTITQSVQNTGATDARVAPYGIVARHGEPSDQKGFFIIHEGVVRMSDGELEEINYDDMSGLDYSDAERANLDLIEVANQGWIGFTDHYWMTSLIPPAGQPFASVAKYVAGSDILLTEARQPGVTIAPGASHSTTSQLFAGAKEWETIRKYERENGIEGFLDSIDWGWFFFLTKPMFALLHWLNSIIGNMGWSIIALTLVIKAAVLPLAYKSYVSMARMKELQPQMEKLKERIGDDRQKMQKEVMELYKKEKVNPASGCLPILVQIPIFFSLYKVIFVTLELRHAPWIGWIKDLSAPDPSSILNLFGLLSFSTPEPGTLFAIVSLGVLPILLGVSMWLQQKLNPAPTDATQAMIFAWMPWVFMFMLGTFASGLVIYWIANNVITFVQQYIIMRSHGHKPDVFGNIRKSFTRKKAE